MSSSMNCLYYSFLEVTSALSVVSPLPFSSQGVTSPSCNDIAWKVGKACNMAFLNIFLLSSFVFFFSFVFCLFVLF